MLKIDKVCINRYKGLNNEKITVISEDIALLKLMSQLDKEKQQITEYNKKHNIKIKGFSANFHNYTRSKNHYSIAENIFKEILESNNIKFLHEHKISVYDTINHKHFYHLDFYLPLLKIAIEINPLFHYTYDTVKIRDLIRTKLLKRKHNIKVLDVIVRFKRKNNKIETYLDEKSVNKAMTEIKKTIAKHNKNPHKETLFAYI